MAPVEAGATQTQSQDPIFAVLGLQQVSSGAQTLPQPPPAMPPLHPSAMMSTPMMFSAYNAWHAAEWYGSADVRPHAADVLMAAELFAQGNKRTPENEELSSSPESGPLLLPDVLPVEHRPCLAVPPLPVEAASSSPTTPFGVEAADASPANFRSSHGWSAPLAWNATEAKELKRDASGDDATATPSASTSSPDGNASEGSSPASSREELPRELNLAARFEEACSNESNIGECNLPKGTIVDLFDSAAKKVVKSTGFRADAPVFVPQPPAPVMSSWTCLATNPHPQPGTSPMASGFVAASLSFTDAAARTGVTPTACAAWSAEAFLESRAMMLRCRLRVLADAPERSMDSKDSLRTAKLQESLPEKDGSNSGDSYATTDEEEAERISPDPSGKSSGKGKFESRSRIRGSAAAARARYAAVEDQSGLADATYADASNWRPRRSRKAAHS